MKTFRRFGFLGIVVSLLYAAPAWGQQETSHARVVRLSFVEGTVTVQRLGVSEWSTAPLNTPIQEGFKLSTAEDGFAEVEFENGSAARLGQTGLIEFEQLGLTSSGAQLNRMTLDQGYATFTIRAGPDDVNEIRAGDATITVDPSSEARFRTDLQNDALRVEVFKGSVSVVSPEGSQQLDQDMVLEIQTGAEQAFVVNKGITKDAWDKWVDEREKALTASMSNPAPGLGPNGVNSVTYGWNDLNNYGNWAYIPGHGYGWYPAAGAGWVPYSYGRWSLYPGFGWVWISSEPWGWLPYHYGEWIFYPGIGWVWIPDDFSGWFGADVVWFEGPGWYGWYPQPVYSPPVNSGGNTGGLIVRGPRAPRGCQASGACGVIVSRNVVERGLPVNSASIIGSNVFKGNPIRAQSLPSSPNAMLPGSPVQGAAGQTRPPTQATGAGRVPGRGRSPAGRTTRQAAGSGIVYDPATGRFINENSANPPTVTMPEPGPLMEPSGGGAESKEPGERPATAPHEAGPPVWSRPAPASGTTPPRSARGGNEIQPRSSGGGEFGHHSSTGGGHSIFGGHSGGGERGSSGGASHGGGGFGGGGGGGSRGGGGSTGGGGHSSSSTGGHH
jgi:uncharacterized protein DUF6600/FecR-like protein